MLSKIKVFVLISLSVLVFLACSGQIKTKDVKSESGPVYPGQVVSELPSNAWTIFQDSKSNYWFGSNGEGLYHYDGKQLIKFSGLDGLSDDSVRGIQEDEAGNIYIETFSGVSKFDGRIFTKLPLVDSADNAWKLEPLDLWFNTNYKDVYRYDGKFLYQLKLPEQNLALLNENLSGDVEDMRYSPYSVFGLDKDSEGNLWIGTSEAGAYRYDGESFLWFGESELSTLPDGRVPGVRSMIQDADGYFWLSNFYSKYKIGGDYEKGYEKVKAVDLPQELVQDKILYFNSGLSDVEGNLWMTTYGGGVWKYDGEKLTNQEVHNGIETVLLLSVYEDNDGLIWLGTHNDGIYVQDGETFVKYELNH